FLSRLKSAQFSVLTLLWLTALSATAELPWTSPEAIMAAAASDSTADTDPSLASDGNGRWVAVWQGLDGGGDLEIFWGLSVDNGVTWTGPNTFYDIGSSTGVDQHPRIATDRNGNWVVVLETTAPFGTPAGPDSDIVSVRSTTNGDLWSAPVFLNPLA